ncbi:MULTISPECIES: phosphatase PAP2 family protein [Sphingomonadales]|uniref:Phosphatase PAP2 family protein n=1 Tax=Sphingobium naphthae TaxID=1886786 RepID=A0ABU4A169_9SPHN|nr:MULTISPECIES: phosphatase PAP2 family protein [Sphingomonadaceae]MDV5825536.1 phosphatase PAP2 family protein [Sphingobium naphthae]
MASERARGLTRRPETLIAGGLALAAALAFLIAKLGSEIAEGETLAFDRGALLWVRQHLGGLPALRAIMLDATALGDRATLTLVVLVVGGYLAVVRSGRLAAFLIVQAAVGTSLASLVKPWFGRVRPDVVPHWTEVASASFPSGHAANSAVVYLSIAMIAARAAPSRPGRAYLMATASLLVILIGFSRIYLGVHYPTDVLAGWAIGGAWALLCGALGSALVGRRRT